MDRRHFVAGSAATAAAFSIRPAFAEDIYPSHAITIINPFPPGGASDVVTRPLAAVLEPIVKQPVVIETKAGAAGAVGAQVAANAKPDGLHAAVPHHIDLRLCRGRQVVRPAREIHPRRFHSAGALRRRPLRAHRQRSAALQDAEGPHRRRHKAAGPDHLLVFGSLWRAAYPDGAVHEGGDC